MSDWEAAAGLGSIIWLALAVILFYGPWQQACIDRARDVVFEQRDRIFDLAADGRLDFGDPAYECVRSSMNALIRLAHVITVPRLGMWIIIQRRSGRLFPPSPDMRQAAAAIPDDQTRQDVLDALRRAETAVLRMMISRSVLATATMALLRLAATLRLAQSMAQVRSRLEPWLLPPLEAEMDREAKRQTRAGPRARRTAAA